MGLVKGGFQRLFQTFLYALLFCCAGIILGVYSYFLSVLADRNRHIPTWEKAVEGMSGAAVLYLIFAVVLTCCLGGITVFALVALILDVLFAGAMIAIAILTRDGADSCKGRVQTPIGNGPANADNGFGSNGFGNDGGENITYSVHLGLACRLNTVAFAVSIIAAFLFLCTAAMQIALVRHHKKEKRYGPSPKNNYTSGMGKRRFGFGKKNKNVDNQAEMGAVPNGRASDVTGTTVGGTGAAPNDKVENHAPHGMHSGYHTQPTGTGVNPYGYNNTTTGTATNY